MRIGTALIVFGFLLIAWTIVSWISLAAIGEAAELGLGQRIVLMLLGVVIMWSGVTWNPDIRKNIAQIVGALFLLFGVAALILQERPEPNLAIVHVTMAAAVVYTILGALLIGAGLFAADDAVTQEPAGTSMNLPWR